MASSPPKSGLNSPITLVTNTSTPAGRQRARSVSSDSSDSSQVTTLSVVRRSPYLSQNTKSPTDGNSSTPHGYARPSAQATRTLNDLPLRTQSPTFETPASHLGHRPRQHSQGFFEPTLPTAAASNAPSMANLTPSQIAAQAAMHVQHSSHLRKRSTTIPEPGGFPGTPTGRRQPASPPPVPSVNLGNSSVQYHNGIVGGNRMAATTAANVVFPRSPLHSPGFPPVDHVHSPVPEMQKPPKERSKMKLFSKPKSIGISKDKDWDKKHPAMPSPNKMGTHSGNLTRVMMNASTTSLVDQVSTGSSLYSSANTSTSTLVPDRAQTYVGEVREKEKEKHKHHFLSRQKNKLKDKDDHHNLPLSSASSISKPADPHAPQTLYNFAAPSSPGHSSTFAQSMSGLDIRHGGRALRQKKKEEKAAASSLNTYLDPQSQFRDRNQSFSQDRSEWPGSASLSSSTTLGPSPTGPASSYAAVDATPSQATLLQLGETFRVNHLGPDDAWHLLKSKMLCIFEGEDIRPPVEDFNMLVSVHIMSCIKRRAPTVLIEDLSELLQTGFSSLDQTLRHVPDDRLVLHLVEMWILVFTTILPFLQAVFLPLDLEFKGRGLMMNAREAAEFWGAALPDSDLAQANSNIPTLGEELDVRRITLLTFRDTVILPRNEILMNIFSRLSLDNISGAVPDPPVEVGGRPGTASSLDPGSYTSQGSTALDSAGSGSLGARSRATSNTSAGSFHSIHLPSSTQPAPPMDSAKVTETVGRMLQCVSVLASVQSGDEAQAKMERLTKELKYNWLGRGRTGRQRRGFVGPRAGLRRGVAGLA